MRLLQISHIRSWKLSAATECRSEKTADNVVVRWRGILGRHHVGCGKGMGDHILQYPPVGASGIVVLVPMCELKHRIRDNSVFRQTKIRKVLFR